MNMQPFSEISMVGMNMAQFPTLHSTLLSETFIFKSSIYYKYQRQYQKSKVIDREFLRITLYNCRNRRPWYKIKR